MRNIILVGDVLERLREIPQGTFQTVVTSPPYFGLRRYLEDDAPEKKFEIGCEATPEEYVKKMVEVFHEVKRTLRDDGTLWFNLGSSYASGGWGGGTEKQDSNRGTVELKGKAKKAPPGWKPKDLVPIPWMVAMALREDGWYLRSDIIWAKPNPMPESVTDRATKSHEYVFLMTKSPQYFFDAEAVKEPISPVSLARAEYGWDCDRPSTKNASMGGQGIHTEKMGQRFVDPSGRNIRTVWTIPTHSFSGAHFATFPEKLVEPCIKAGTSERGACANCGTPWERVVEREPGVSKEYPKTQSSHEARGGTGRPRGTVGKSGSGRTEGFTSTLGWQKSCKCETDETRPCLVLDCFGGAGTVGVVAKRLRRDWMLIELNPAYAKMSEERIDDTPQPML